MVKHATPADASAWPALLLTLLTTGPVFCRHAVYRHPFTTLVRQLVTLRQFAHCSLAHA